MPTLADFGQPSKLPSRTINQAINPSPDSGQTSIYAPNTSGTTQIKYGLGENPVGTTTYTGTSNYIPGSSDVYGYQNSPADVGISGYTDYQSASVGDSRTLSGLLQQGKITQDQFNSGRQALMSGATAINPYGFSPQSRLSQVADQINSLQNAQIDPKVTDPQARAAIQASNAQRLAALQQEKATLDATNRTTSQQNMMNTGGAAMSNMQAQQMQSQGTQGQQQILPFGNRSSPEGQSANAGALARQQQYNQGMNGQPGQQMSSPTGQMNTMGGMSGQAGGTMGGNPLIPGQQGGVPGQQPPQQQSFDSGMLNSIIGSFPSGSEYIQQALMGVAQTMQESNNTSLSLYGQGVGNNAALQQQSDALTSQMQSRYETTGQTALSVADTAFNQQKALAESVRQQQQAQNDVDRQNYLFQTNKTSRDMTRAKQLQVSELTASIALSGGTYSSSAATQISDAEFRADQAINDLHQQAAINGQYFSNKSLEIDNEYTGNVNSAYNAHSAATLDALKTYNEGLDKASTMAFSTKKDVLQENQRLLENLGTTLTGNHKDLAQSLLGAAKDVSTQQLGLARISWEKQSNLIQQIREHAMMFGNTDPAGQKALMQQAQDMGLPQSIINGWSTANPTIQQTMGIGWLANQNTISQTPENYTAPDGTNLGSQVSQLAFKLSPEQKLSVTNDLMTNMHNFQESGGTDYNSLNAAYAIRNKLVYDQIPDKKAFDDYTYVRNQTPAILSGIQKIKDKYGNGMMYASQWSDISQKLGNSGDQDIVAAKDMLDAVHVSFRKSQFGVRVSEGEQQAISGVIGNIEGESPDTLITKVKTLDKLTAASQEAMIQGVLGGGPGFNSAGSPGPQDNGYRPRKASTAPAGGYANFFSF